MGRPVCAMIADSGTHTVSMLALSQRGAPSFGVRPVDSGGSAQRSRRYAARCSVGRRVRAEAEACATLHVNPGEARVVARVPPPSEGEQRRYVVIEPVESYIPPALASSVGSSYRDSTPGSVCAEAMVSCVESGTNRSDRLR